MTFPEFPRPHDPDDVGFTYTFPFVLDPGVSIVSPTIVEVRGGDGTKDEPYVPEVGETPLTIGSVAFAATVIDGVSCYGVTFIPTGGSFAIDATTGEAVDRLYAIRCRVTLSNGARGDVTQMLRVRST